MNILLFKALSIVLIIAAAFAGGYIPLRKSVSDGKTMILLYGNAFAGGVFLGAGLLHMLPDASDNFSQLKLSIDYPFAPLIAGLGFLLVLMIEKLIAGDEESEIIKKSDKFPLVLFLVLSIHSIIAGMSLGLESTLLEGIVIFIAIISHKASAAFSLSVNMVSNNNPVNKIKKSIALFSIMTPAGILIGGILDNIESSNISIWFEAIFDSLAAGTFIYIAIMEIINEVFEKQSKRAKIFSFMVSGFSLMTIIAIWT